MESRCDMRDATCDMRDNTCDMRDNTCDMRNNTCDMRELTASCEKLYQRDNACELRETRPARNYLRLITCEKPHARCHFQQRDATCDMTKRPATCAKPTEERFACRNNRIIIISLSYIIVSDQRLPGIKDSRSAILAGMSYVEIWPTVSFI